MFLASLTYSTMSIIPKRLIGQEFSFADVVLLAVDGIEALIKQCQEWKLLPADGQIKCPVNDCNGTLVRRPKSDKKDGCIWKCTGKRGESSKRKVTACNYE